MQRWISDKNVLAVTSSFGCNDSRSYVLLKDKSIHSIRYHPFLRTECSVRTALPEVSGRVRMLCNGPGTLLAIYTSKWAAVVDTANGSLSMLGVHGIRKLAWHPTSPSHLCVLDESRFSLFRMECSHRFISVLESHTKHNGMVSFEFSSNRMSWNAFCIFFLKLDGSVWYICPIIPSSTSIPSSEMETLFSSIPHNLPQNPADVLYQALSNFVYTRQGDECIFDGSKLKLTPRWQRVQSSNVSRIPLPDNAEPVALVSLSTSLPYVLLFRLFSSGHIDVFVSYGIAMPSWGSLSMSRQTNVTEKLEMVFLRRDVFPKWEFSYDLQCIGHPYSNRLFMRVGKRCYSAELEEILPFLDGALDHGFKMPKESICHLLYFPLSLKKLETCFDLFLMHSAEGLLSLSSISNSKLTLLPIPADFADSGETFVLKDTLKPPRISKLSLEKVDTSDLHVELEKLKIDLEASDKVPRKMSKLLPGLKSIASKIMDRLPESSLFEEVEDAHRLRKMKECLQASEQIEIAELESIDAALKSRVRNRERLEKLQELLNKILCLGCYKGDESNVQSGCLVELNKNLKIVHLIQRELTYLKAFCSRVSV